MRLTRKRLEILVAATNEAHARSFPPYSNWRTLMKFGSWSPTETARAKVQLIGRAEPGVEPGPILFGSL